MAGNMESMLLGGSDGSSSDDSDNELEEVTTGMVASAAAAAVQPQPVVPPVAAPLPSPASAKAQSDRSARLKSLYSPANKATPASSRSVQPTQSNTMPSMPNISAAPASRVSSTSSRGPQQQPQTHMPSPRQQQPATHYRPLVPNKSSKPPPQSMPPAVPRTSDPFEPTPLRKMIEREQAKATTTSSMSQVPTTSAPTHSSVGRRPSSSSARVSSAVNNRVAASGIKVSGIPLHQSNSTSSTSSSVSTVRATNVAPATAAAQRQRQEQEAKRRKEKFLMFTRVLMKYLEQKDPDMHARAKSVIRECAEKNKNKEAGYESVTASMQTRLRATVGDQYWKRAENYLNHFLSQKKQKVEEDKRKEKKLLQEKQERDRAAARHKIEQIEKQAAEMKKQKDKKKEEANARKRAKAREQQAAKKMAAAAQQQATADRLVKQQREIAARKAALEAVAGKTVQQQAAAVRSMAQAEAKKSKKTATDKARKSPAVPVGVVTTEPKVETPPREYSLLMEAVDHAVTYDWTSAATLLDKDHKTDINLNEEQNKLLYGEKATPAGPGIQAASMVAGTSVLPPALRGWSKRNVLSARTAWARIRLGEQKEQAAGDNNGMPVVAGFTIPGSAKTDGAKASVAGASGVVPGAGQVVPPATTPVPISTTTWFNDEKAEEDKTLALLSEATETYLKSLLEKAIHSARQRENLDGIRLWHLQHSTKQKPPLSIRLGCDVKRQVAQVAGNAAKTSKRMEEALARQKGVPAAARELDNDETLYQATSMSDLSMRPMMASAASQADLNAKRSYEVYGGKDSGAPPFGRVPKKAKIVVRDFQSGLDNSSWFPHQRTGVAAASFI